MEERSVQFLYSFPTRRMVGGCDCDPFYLKFWVNWLPLERNRRFSTDIRRSASAVTSSKKFNFELFARYRITTSITLVF